jgi:preprotein translocase subunit YajC
MPADQAANPILSLVPYVLIFLIFYFVVIKPQRKQQKELEDMRKAVKKNDAVVTAGGIHGTVVNVKDKTIVVRVDDNVKIEFDKEAVTSVTKSSS